MAQNKKQNKKQQYGKASPPKRGFYDRVPGFFAVWAVCLGFCLDAVCQGVKCCLPTSLVHTQQGGGPLSVILLKNTTNQQIWGHFRCCAVAPAQRLSRNQAHMHHAPKACCKIYAVRNQNCTTRFAAGAIFVAEQAKKFVGVLNEKNKLGCFRPRRKNEPLCVFCATGDFFSRHFPFFFPVLRFFFSELWLFVTRLADWCVADN